MNFYRQTVGLSGLIIAAFSTGLHAQTRPASKLPAKEVKPLQMAKSEAVWRENGSPVVGLSVASGRVLLTEGSDSVALYGADGTLQKRFVPKDADGFRVYSYDCAISPDGKYGLIASVDLGARLLDLESEKVVTNLSGGMMRINAVAYSPDGKNLAVATAGGVIVAGAPERTVRPGFKNPGAESVAFSPDGTMLAVGGEDKVVRLFKIDDGSELASWRGHEGAVRALSWSRDGKKLASGGRDGSVLVWNIETRQRLIALSPGEGAIESLAWSAGGTVLAVAVSPAGKESSARPSEPERNPPGPAEAPRPVVQLWSIQNAKATLKRAVPSLYGARKIAFAPDGTLLAGFADGRLAAYDLAAIPLVAPPAGAAPAVQVGGKKPVRVPAARPAAVPAIPAVREDAEGFRTLTGLAGGAQTAAFSRDGALLAAGNAEAEIGLWDTKTGLLRRRIGGHARGVNSIAWSPDGAFLASGGEDRLQIARVADGEVVWSAPGRAVVAGWSPDGKTVFAFVESSQKEGRGGEVLSGWSVTDGKPGPMLGKLPYPMRALISPDGTLIAADQGRSEAYLDATMLSVFATAPQTPNGAATRSWSALHGRVNALSWPKMSRLLVDEGDYRDGHDDYDKPVPGKLGVRFFDPTTGKEAAALKTFEMPIVALDENLRGELAVAEDRIAVCVFDTGQREIAQWPLPARNVRVKSLAWSPDGAVLAIAIEGAPLRLWRVQRP